MSTDMLEVLTASGVEPDTVDAIMAAVQRFGPGAWAATTWEGSRVLGNGLGDHGRGKTWADALDELTRKDAARRLRYARIEADRLNARDRLRKALAWGSIAAGAALALWLAWR